jgi:hypothetical protein
MFRPNVARPVFRPRGGVNVNNGSDTGILIVAMGGMMLLFLMIVVLFLIIYRQKQKTGLKKSTTRARETTIQEVRKRVRASAEELGLDSNALEQELEKQVELEKQKRCMVSPLRNGQCSPNYTLEDGCCYPNESAPPNPNAAKVDLAKDLAIAIGGGLIVDAMLTAAITAAARGLKGTKGAVAGAKIAGSVARGAATAGKAAYAAGKALVAAAKATRIAAAAARAAAAAAKAAATAAKYAVAAAGGPLGLAVAVAMLIFDIVSIILDSTDAGGYESETSNAILNRIKNVIDYETSKALEKEGIEYPLLFPLAIAFPEEFEAAMLFANAQVEDKHLIEELKKDDEVLVIAAEFADEVFENENAEIPEAFTKFLNELPRKFHKERDQFVFQKLQEILGPKAYMIDIYEKLSTPDRIAVTLSQRGVQEWNDSKKEIWFANNDLFKQPDPPPRGEDPFAALYTDTYYVYESGPSDKPVMAPRKLEQRTALAGLYGSIVAFCEKPRKLKSTSPTIVPTDLGVEFEYDTGICKFTREYCSRYGLEFSNNNCKLRPGQYVAELIFGKTVTRDIIRAFTSPPSYAKKSKGPATKGPCPPGMRDDGINCWLDPVYRGPGKPMGCKDDEEKKGQLCYPKCREGYNSSALECEGTCPDGSRNTGLTCLQSIHAYIPGNQCSNPLRGCFYRRKDCRDGYRYRGTTCNKECLPNFTFRSGAAGSAFCDKPRNRYSRAGDAKPLSSCPEGYEKQGLLCYPKCKNKGERGQYKYNGVLDWCQPEGAAGIKKGLDDRWECPEGSKSIAGICYQNCKPGESDDGLLCNPP